MNEISHQLAINPAEILDQCVLNDDVGSVVVMETPCLNSTWSYWIQLWSQSITTRLVVQTQAGHRLFNWCFADIHTYLLQVILFQKHSFFHQLAQNMTTDCSLNYEFNTRKLQILCILCRLKPKHFNLGFSGTLRSFFVIFLLNYYPLHVDLLRGWMSASDKELPVRRVSIINWINWTKNALLRWFAKVHFIHGFVRL
jgi:hypothetical protein